MLSTLHSIAKGFAAKLLLALLVLSFAIWGIGDMINAPSRDRAVATVGKDTITQEAFRRTLTREVEKIRNVMGESYSPDMLAQLKLPQQIIKMMVGQSLIRQEVIELGLKVPDESLTTIIRNNPAFQDGKGNFNKEMLRQRLASAGITEAAFLDQMRNQEAARLVLDSFAFETAVHEEAVKTLYLSRNQKRSISLYTADASIVKDVPKPSKEAVETFYKNNAPLFRVPEFRTLSYTTFTADNIKKGIKILDEELQAAYEDRQDEFRHEEKRVVEQLLYSSEDKAKEAAAMAKDGKSFADIAEATNATNKKSLSMGSVTEKSMFEGAGAAVFALPEKGVSDPVQSPFGWHVFRVAAIEPASIEPFEKVKDRLSKDLLAQKQEEAVGKFANTLEDTFAAGNDLHNVAKEHDLSVHTLPAMNADGKTADGKEATLPKLDKFLAVAFKLDEKTESAVTFSKGGTYYIVRADKIETERTRPLEDVMDKAEQLATLAARQEKLITVMEAVAKDFADTSKRSSIVARHGLSAITVDDVKRTDSKIADHALPPAMIADMFVRRSGDATEAYQLADGSFVIAVVNSITPAKLPEDGTALAALRKEMQTAFHNEIMDEYMNYLATKHTVNVKADAVSAVQPN